MPTLVFYYCILADADPGVEAKSHGSVNEKSDGNVDEEAVGDNAVHASCPLEGVASGAAEAALSLPVQMTMDSQYSDWQVPEEIWDIISQFMVLL